MKNNRIVIDLDKCQYARFFYRNQYGQTVNTLPKRPTVRGLEFDPDEYRFRLVSDEPKETLISYATRHNLLDVWVPEVRFQLQANHSLTYTGEKAVSLFKEWGRRMFSKK